MGVCVGARKNARRFFLALLIAVACMVVVFPGCRSTGDPFADLVIKEYKTGRYDEIEVAPGFILHSNMWGTEEATDQKICLYEDGSYGWEWKRGDSGEDKYNYPEIFYGIKPWGQGVDDDELLLPK